MNLTPEQSAKCAPDHPIYQVMDRLEKIQDTMLRNDPELRTHLKEIHKLCKEYEELAHILTPEQIGVLMKGMQKYTAISIVTEDAKKPSSKKLGKLTTDDLI